MGLGFWTMPWKCACLQAGLSTTMPSAAAITSLLDWCSFLAWDQSGWWTADTDHQPRGAEPLGDRDWEPDHRVVQHTCMLQLQWHGHEMNFPLPGRAWTYCFELMPSSPPGPARPSQTGRIGDTLTEACGPAALETAVITMAAAFPDFSVLSQANVLFTQGIFFLKPLSITS